MCGSKGGNNEPVVKDHYWPAPEDGGPKTDAERESLAVERGNEAHQSYVASITPQKDKFGYELGSGDNSP